jgi:signal transduction histidine kinase
MASLPPDAAFLAYVGIFGAAAVACFAGVPRAASIDHATTRRGLVALLVASGAWASAHVGFLVAPTTGLALAFHYAGLIIGFGTVGPWLYFCSAYTGRRLHRSRPLRRLAAGVFLAVVAAKLTNPIHGRYFRTSFVETPFPHLTVTNEPLHWLAMGLAYALSAVGYFMLIELFWQVGHETRPLVVLVGLTGLPVVLDFAGATSPLLLDITYEPLGVAAFSVGVLFVYFDDLRSVQLAGERDDPVIVLDDDNRVRDYNAEAEKLFEELTVDGRVDAVVPELAEHLDTGEAVVDIQRVGGMRYYQLSANPFSTAEASRGRLITLTDITERERYRTELERQNRRLERFASVVSHDLRNPLSIAKGRLELAREVRDDEDLAATATALERMETLIEDLLTLAREGRLVDGTEPVSLAAVAEESWSFVETDEATLTVEGDLTFEAEGDRVKRLFENLFRNTVEHGSTSPPSQAREDSVEHSSTGSRPKADDAVEHDSTSPPSRAREDAVERGSSDDGSVTVEVGPLADGDGFYVADDGPGIPEEERGEVFEFGYSTEEAGTGFGLAIVKEVAEAHGWTASATESEAGGARFEISGVGTGRAVAETTDA